MVAVGKGFERYRGAIGDVSFPRPQPADVELIAQEGIDRVMSAVFALDTVYNLAVPVCDQQTIRVPYIAADNHINRSIWQIILTIRSGGAACAGAATN
jgi:hypothetical protein